MTLLLLTVIVDSLLDSKEYAIIALTETFLSSDVPDSVILSSCPGFVLFRSDQASFGGGVAICCLSSLQPVCVSIDCSSGCDIVALDLHGPVSCHLICCYRPPSASCMQTVQFCADLMKLCDCQLPWYSLAITICLK